MTAWRLPGRSYGQRQGGVGDAYRGLEARHVLFCEIEVEGLDRLLG